MAGEFLPKVKVTTIVWAEEGRGFGELDCGTLNWECAQGDDLKLNISTIELNLVKIADRCNYDVELITQEMIKHWIAMEVVLGTRQDLIDKGVRGKVRDEDILYKANLETILSSPELFEEYKDMAVKAIISGQHYVYPKGGRMGKLFKDITSPIASSILRDALRESVSK